MLLRKQLNIAMIFIDNKAKAKTITKLTKKKYKKDCKSNIAVFQKMKNKKNYANMLTIKIKI